jgi:hypothetical protein
VFISWETRSRNCDNIPHALGFAPARAFQEAVFKAEISATSFAVADVQKAYERLKALGVVFHGAPARMGPVTIVSFEDTCGKLIQIAQQ